MPTYKISQLTTATAVSATNQFEINQNGASRSLEVSVLGSYMGLQFAAGRLLNIQTFVSAGAYTYTKTSGTNSAIFYLRGPGGAGGDSSGPGNSGGTTTLNINGTLVEAAGGSGGGGYTVAYTSGGLGGTGGTNGTFSIRGQAGGAGFKAVSAAIAGFGGGEGGGRAPVAAPTGASAGTDGRSGGGGSGAITSTGFAGEIPSAAGGGGEGELVIRYVQSSLSTTHAVSVGRGGIGKGTPTGGSGGDGYILVYEYS